MVETKTFENIDDIMAMIREAADSFHAVISPADGTVRISTPADAE